MRHLLQLRGINNFCRIRSSADRVAAMQSIRDVVREFYVELEQLSLEHEELTDTDVREALHETLNYVFVWGKQLERLPVTYFMFTRAGDAAVAATVARLLATIVPLAERLGLDVGQPRLDALQDASITTPQGNKFDSFLGQVDVPLALEPLHEQRFEPGDYSET
jgi:hypothetical protein